MRGAAAVVVRMDMDILGRMDMVFGQLVGFVPVLEPRAGMRVWWAGIVVWWWRTRPGGRPRGRLGQPLDRARDEARPEGEREPRLCMSRRGCYVHLDAVSFVRCFIMNVF